MPTQHPNVFDLASLRVHADGSRATRNSKSRAAQVGLNAQAKLIAKDAGGRFVRETHRRAGRKRKYEDAEDFGEEIEDVEGGDKDEDEDYEPTRETKPTVAALKARTRRASRVIRDLADIKEPPKLAEDFPSSDLLKNIHYHAVQYYTSSGQLYNHAATLRKEYKERKAARSPRDPPHHSSAKAKTRKSGTGKRKERKRKTFKTYVSILKRRQKASRKWQPDMYRMFEGSALVCFGMLMQEMIKWQVRPRIPDGWVDESDQDEYELTDGDDVEEEEEEAAVVDLASGDEEDVTPIGDEEVSNVEAMEVDGFPSIAKPPLSVPPTSTVSVEQDNLGRANSPAANEPRVDGNELGDVRTPEESSEEEESTEEHRAATSEDGDADRDENGDSHSRSAESESDDEWQGIRDSG